MPTKAKTYQLALLVGVPRISKPGGESVVGGLNIKGRFPVQLRLTPQVGSTWIL